MFDGKPRLSFTLTKFGLKHLFGFIRYANMECTDLITTLISFIYSKSTRQDFFGLARTLDTFW